MIHKIKLALIRKVQGWLGITELIKENASLKSSVQESNGELSRLKSALKVGVDYHENPSSSSWAIVCLDGKHEYIRLVSFKNTDSGSIREIRDFLRNFKQENVIIDRRSGMDRRWFFEIEKIYR